MDSKLNEIHLFYFVVLNNSNNNNDDNCNYFYSFEYFCLRLQSCKSLRNGLFMY